MILSKRSQVDPFIVMDIMEAARLAEHRALAEDRPNVIHMEVGQPGTPAPVAAQAALSDALKSPLGYTVALGLPELRAEIAALYDRWYGLDLNPARVVVTAGSSGAFLLAFTALFDAGARVGIGAPGYPSYRQILRALSLNAVDIPTQAENGYQLMPDDISGLDGVLVASPGNPTGSMIGHDQMAALTSRATDQGTAFISDEIYHGIEYGQRGVCALEVTDQAYVINSFSKYFSMTGWRIGWMIVPDDHIRTVERLAQNMFICPPHASQVAALGALKGGTQELDQNLSVYARNRQVVLEALPKMGLPRFAPPDGAFYVYVDVSDYSNDSLALAHDILEKAGVAVTPGVDFDPARGHQFLRLSYARAHDDICEGMKRLTQYFTEKGR